MSSSATSIILQYSDRRRQKALGNELKRLYAEVIAEPIPAEFLLLFAEMDRKQAAAECAP